MTRAARAALLAALLAAPGCATVMNGSRQQVPVEVEPAGASVRLFPERTRHEAPTVLTPERKSVHTLLVEHPGHEPALVYLDRAASPWVLGDLAFVVYPAALWLDARWGGAYQLRPSRVKLRLRPLADAPPAAGTEE